MLNKTSVTTSFVSGMTINMDLVAMKMFLEGLATTIIVQSREMNCTDNKDSVINNINLPHYNDLIEEYCDGFSSAILTNMLNQNVQILYSFVEDCVLNETVKGLYLLKAKTKTGKYTWELITLALDEYMEFVKREFKTVGKNIPYNFPQYNKYNEDFATLMLK